VAQCEKELLVDEGLRCHFDFIANPIIAAGQHAGNFAAFAAKLRGL
jgi:hypothetical protein